MKKKKQEEPIDFPAYAQLFINLAKEFDAPKRVIREQYEKLLKSLTTERMYKGKTAEEIAYNMSHGDEVTFAGDEQCPNHLEDIVNEAKEAGVSRDTIRNFGKTYLAMVLRLDPDQKVGLDYFNSDLLVDIRDRFKLTNDDISKAVLDYFNERYAFGGD
jgi:hypothetical protein